MNLSELQRVVYTDETISGLTHEVRDGEDLVGIFICFGNRKQRHVADSNSVMCLEHRSSTEAIMRHRWRRKMEEVALA